MRLDVFCCILELINAVLKFLISRFVRDLFEENKKHFWILISHLFLNVYVISNHPDLSIFMQFLKLQLCQLLSKNLFIKSIFFLNLTLDFEGVSINEAGFGFFLLLSICTLAFKTIQNPETLAK